MWVFTAPAGMNRWGWSFMPASRMSYLQNQRRWMLI
jgi:hypothetical protein